MYSYFNLQGKTALITGASGGLGEQFAITLNRAGCRVILAARRIEKLKDIASQLGDAKAIYMDVSHKQSVNDVFTKLHDAGEKIDICINNAAIGLLTPIFSKEENNDFAKTIETNLLGVWYVTQAVANHMKDNHIHGSIINISSVNGEGKLAPEISGSSRLCVEF